MFRIADEWIEPRWIKEGSQRNNDICAHHTSPSYFAIIEKRRRWPGNAFVPMDETSRKVRFTGIEARDNSTVFFNPPLFDPRGRGTYEVRIKLCVSSAIRFWKFSPDGICWRETLCILCVMETLLMDHAIDRHSIERVDVELMGINYFWKWLFNFNFVKLTRWLISKNIFLIIEFIGIIFIIGAIIFFFSSCKDRL